MLISIVLLAVILVVTLFNAATAPMLKKPVGLQHCSRVSVLIPARNEEANVGACIEGFLSQNYDNFKIYVLDDQSTDRTGAIIEKFGKQYPEVQAIHGKPLPAEWSGKNWACHQLSQYADGEIFIFTDADNRPAPNAIANTVAYMQKLELGLLSAFPEKVTITLAEKLVVPVVDMFVYAGLPLWLTYLSRFPSLAAASGLWIAFTSEAYQQVGGHQAVSNQIVEDVELSRLAKKRGIKILTSAGTRVVSCRMYQSFSEVWDGFSKNLFGLVGYKTIPFFILIFSLFTMCVLPYIAVSFAPLRGPAIVAIAMNTVIRIVLALKYRHPLFTSVILHPFGVLLTLMIGINSFCQVRRGRLQWKGRQIDPKIAVSSQQSAATKRTSNREFSYNDENEACNNAQKCPSKNPKQNTQAILEKKASNKNLTGLLHKVKLKYKIGALYLLLGAGGLWHVFGVFQEAMRVLASPIMIGLGVWLFWECWRVYPRHQRPKFSIVSVGVVVVSFGIEWLGVRTGEIFGSYQYGETLQPSIDGVPISIGSAWFVTLVASTAVAQKIAPKSLTKGSHFKIALLVALLMVCFDLLMEPAAVKLDYWTWMNDPIPLRNYLVWFGLSFIFATIGLQIGLFRQLLPRIAIHLYFAQLIYFGLVVLKR